INFEHARQDVRRKRREFASDFDKWTRGNGKEQQQDGKSSSRDAKIERGGIESDKQRNKHEHDEHKEKSQRNSQKSRARRSEEHTSELQSRFDLVCRLLLEKKKK